MDENICMDENARVNENARVYEGRNARVDDPRETVIKKDGGHIPPLAAIEQCGIEIGNPLWK